MGWRVLIWLSNLGYRISIGVLDTIWHHVSLYIGSQIIKTKDILKKYRCKVGKQQIIPPFQHLIGRVSHFSVIKNDIYKGTKVENYI